MRGESIRVGVIGCGAMGTYHAQLIAGRRLVETSALQRILGQSRRMIGRRLRQVRSLWTGGIVGPSLTAGIAGVELWAAADVDPDRLRSFQERFRIPHGFRDYQDLLHRDEIEAVLICVPHHRHAEVARAALDARKHVFIEKPMARSGREARDIVNLARKHGLVLQVGYVLRYSEERGRIRKAIATGEIGRPVWYRLVRTPTAGPPTSWAFEAREGGGILWYDTHEVDFLRFTLGDPSTVYAVTGRFKPGKTTAPDTVSICFTFPQGDQALVSESYAIPLAWNTAPRRCLTWIDVLGPRGVLTYPDEDGRSCLVIRSYEDGRVRRMPWFYSEWGADGFVAQLEDFFDCIRTGRKPIASGEEALRTIELIEACERSAETDSVVTFRPTPAEAVSSNEDHIPCGS